MTTTPGWTIAIVAIQVVTTACGMFEVVGQREQEAFVIAKVVVVAVPRCTCIATNEFACVQLDHGYGGSFAITAAVECGRTSTMYTALVAEEPVLVGGPNPLVDLNHL